MLIRSRPIATVILKDFNLNASGEAVTWADVGFWIRPDGTTAEIEILRSSGPATRWVDPAIEQIGDRRYLPRLADAGTFGAYRVERISLRSRWGMAAGTRIAGRVGVPHFVAVDLTHLSDADEARALSLSASGDPRVQN